MRIRSQTITVILVVLAMAGAAWAEPPAVLYHLKPGSTFEEGCYGECLCPIIQAPLEGTFGLELLPTLGPLDTYGVSEVDFVVPALNRLLTGSGFYTLAGEFNQLSLDLQMNGEPAQLFDSGGFVAAGAEFPEIDIVISINQMLSCFDTVLHIVASPFAYPDPWLAVAPSQLTWTPVAGAQGYDVVCGDLGYLRASSGNFTTSTDVCLEDGYAGTSTTYDLTPLVGDALWFVVRAEGGSYDSTQGSPVAPRDPGIDASSAACP